MTQECYPNECGGCCVSITRQEIYRMLREVCLSSTKNFLVTLLETMDSSKVDRINLVIGVNGKNATRQ